MNTCPTCAYDWVANPAGIAVELLSEVVKDSALHLRCPLCAASLSGTVRLRDLGVVHDPLLNLFFQWKDAPATMFTLSDRREVHPSEIVYGRVPVFHDGDGFIVPAIPVRPDYIALVDLEAFAGDVERYAGRLDARTGQYTALVPLKGRAPYPVQCLVAAQPDGAPVDDLDHTIWPRVRSRAWRTFVVSATLGKHAMQALGGSPDVRFFVGGETDPQCTHSITCPEVPFVGFEGGDASAPGARRHPETTRFAGLTSEGRPTWVSVSGRDAGTGQQLGGLFRAAASERAPEGNRPALRVGLDFGTSNTCVAFGQIPGDASGTKRFLPVRDLNEYLVRSAQSRNVLLCPAHRYHPSFARRGFGESGDVFPSELMFRWDASLVLAGGDEASQIERWIPGIDCTVFGNDIDWKGARSSGVTQSHLKWNNQIGFEARHAIDDSLRQRLLVAYLKTLLVYEAALYIDATERAHGAPAPSTLQLYFGYPGNFAEVAADLKRALQRATAAPDPNNPALAVKWGLADWCDLATDVQEGIDEAQAASRAAQPLHGLGLRAGYILELLVDIGGGSTDVAVTWKPTVEEDDPSRAAALEVLTSVRYAGEDVVEGLFGQQDNSSTRTVVPGLTREAVKTAIRGGAPARSVLDPYKHKDALRRVETFYLQLIEWLARLVAAQALAGHFKEICASSEELTVQLVPLGNGWGLARLQEQWSDPFRVLSERIERRVTELLAAHEGMPTVRVHVRPIEGIAPKQAVADGLLKGGNAGAKRARSRHGMEVLPAAGPHGGLVKPQWRWRSIVGLPVRIVTPGTTQADDRTIAWWSSVQAGAFHPHEHGEPVPLRASATWDVALLEATGAGMPETLVDRTTLERVLGESVHELERSADGWFVKSPLESLLQGGLRSRLKSL